MAPRLRTASSLTEKVCTSTFPTASSPPGKARIFGGGVVGAYGPRGQLQNGDVHRFHTRYLFASLMPETRHVFLQQSPLTP